MYYDIKHDNIVVVGSGHSIKRYKTEILQLISRYNCKTIGINDMTELCISDYHLWTNRKRLGEFGSCINKKSILMFGQNIPSRNIKKQFSGEYIKVNYKDSDEIILDEKSIQGRFRTAGTLAIAIAYLMEAKNIWVAGMDGFTLHPKSRLRRDKRSQHCYGSGLTDDATWEECVEKDRIVSESLDKLSKIINFKLITPTKFNKHYDLSILGIKK